MLFNENQRLSKELDEALVEVNRNIQKYRENERNSANGFFFRLIRPLFSNYKLLGKSSISNADINEVQKDQRLEELFLGIKTILHDSMPQDCKKATQNNMFSLYDEIIRRTTLKDRVVVNLLTYLSSLLMAFDYFVIFQFTYSMSRESTVQLELKHFIQYICMLVIGIILTRYVISKRDSLQFNQSSKVKHSLMILSYHKLIISDLGFLRSCDDSTLHRLFYWNLEDYANSSNIWSTMLRFVLWWVIFLTHIFLPEHTRLTYVPFLLAGALITILIIFTTYKSTIYFRNYLEIILCERETLFELVNGFKTLKFTQFIDVYREKLKVLAQKREEVLATVYSLDFRINQCLSMLPYAGPIFFILFIFLDNTKHLISKGTLDHSTRGSQYYNLSAFFTNLAISPYILSEIRGAIEELKGWLSRDKAKQFYDIFLGNNDTIQAAVAKDPDLRLGEIVIDSVDIFEREDHHHKSSITEIYKKKDRDSGVGTARKVVEKSRRYKRISRIIPQSAQHNQLPSSHKEHGLDRTPLSLRSRPINIDASHDKYVKLIGQNIMFSINPADIVCIIWSQSKKHQIRGFINSLVGENLIGNGSIRYNGNISFYSQERMPFLGGSTIRDNILFGEKYNAERYEMILDMMGVKFDRYDGRDFYQVSEKGLNVQAEDKLFISFARLIYKESSIYIIEDLFTDGEYKIHMKMYEKVFKNLLKGKTLIYVAKDKNIVMWGTRFIKFQSNCRYKVYTKDKLISSIERQESSSKNNLLSERFSLSNTRTQRPYFVANTSFEEELAVFKKIEKEKELIDKKKIQSKSLIERIAYGIYLTNKRREEGRNIYDYSVLKSNEYSTFCSNFLRKQAFKCKRLNISLVSSCLSHLCIMTMEYFLIKGFFDDSTLQFITDINGMMYCLILLILHILFRCISSSIMDRRSRLNSRDNHDKIVNMIIDSPFNFIRFQNTHELIGVPTDNLLKAETEFHKCFLNLIESAIVISLCFINIFLIYSLYMPAIIILIYSLCMRYILKMILPSFIGVISFANFNQNKKDSFNYQLLNLIFGYRVSSLMHKLNDKFLSLSNNLVRNEKLILIDYKQLFMRLNSIIQLLVGSALLIMFVGYVRSDKLHLYPVQKATFIWSLTHMIRMVESMDLFMSNILSYYTNLIYLYKIERFLQVSEEQMVESKRPAEKLKEVDEFRRNKVADFAKPISFRKVSLTLGYRPVLKKISFLVRMGNRLGIVGGDGSGRGAIFDLILGLKNRDTIQTSVLRIFNLPVELIDDNTREDIRVSMREVQMYEGTIRSNIDPYSRFEDKKIIEVLKQLGIEKVLYREIYKNQINVRRTKFKTNLKQKAADIFREMEFSISRPIGSIAILSEIGRKITTRTEQNLKEPNGNDRKLNTYKELLKINPSKRRILQQPDPLDELPSTKRRMNEEPERNYI